MQPPTAGAWRLVERDVVRRLDRLLARLGDTPVLLDPSMGWVSLHDGSLVRPLHVPWQNDSGVAVSPDARRVAYPSRNAENLVIADADAVLPESGSLPFWPPITFDVSGDVFVGKRKVFRWLDREGALLAEGETPHIRKDVSSKSNLFRWIHVAPDRTRVLSVADCDVVLSDLAPGRAPTEHLLLYQSCYGADGDWSWSLDWESDRERHATVTLGPDARCRYLVGLHRLTARGIGEEGELLPVAEAYAIYDIHHREVDRRPGILLGGHLDSIVGVHRGRLFRETVSTGERLDLGREERLDLALDARELVDAVPLPGTGSVVLVVGKRFSCDPVWIRVV